MIGYNTWDAKVELGQLVETSNHGETIQSYEWTPVFANEESLTRSEFYQAANAGLKPEVMLKIHAYEFDNQEKVKYKGKTYTILRTYEKGDNVVLTLSAVVGT